MKKGFTLIELLVVVLIIGILAAIAVPQYQVAVEKARTAEMLSIASSVEKAVQMWFLAGASSKGVGNKFINSNPDIVLDIDLDHLDCDANFCNSKNFRYYGYCNGGFCGLDIYRFGLYSVRFELEGAGIVYADCVFYADLGEKICKILESQGTVEDVSQGDIGDVM